MLKLEKLREIIINKRLSLIRMALEKWDMQTKRITIDDEESQLKVEILRSLVNQML